MATDGFNLEQRIDCGVVGKMNGGDSATVQSVELAFIHSPYLKRQAIRKQIRNRCKRKIGKADA
ncbi:MAG: hypothetical protein CVV45_09385, partial [Spirochaetae bacterium HGW-Spirochaetae-10]